MNEPTVNDLTELMNAFKNQTPSSPTWYQVIDHVVGTLLAVELQRAQERAAHDNEIREECAKIAERKIEAWKELLPDERPDCYEAAEFIAADIRASKLWPR